MKLILVVFTLLTSVYSFATSMVTWNKVEIEKSYSLAQKLRLQYDEGEIVISKNTKLSLIEVTRLPMLKVKFHKYQLSKCSYKNIATDLELISIVQTENETTSVGVNLSKGCILDVYIDLEDQKSISFLK